MVLESTTYPGTTDTDLRAVLVQFPNCRAGQEFHLAYSPEREDPGNPDSQVARIPKVIGGKVTYAGISESLMEVKKSDRYAFEKVDICEHEGIDFFICYQPEVVVQQPPAPVSGRLTARKTGRSDYEAMTHSAIRSNFLRAIVE